MLAACVMTLEARDNAAKIVPATVHVDSPGWATSATKKNIRKHKTHPFHQI